MSRKCFSSLVPAVAVLILLCSLNSYTQPLATPTRYRLSVADKNVALEVVLPTVGVYDIRRNEPIPPAFLDPTEGFTKDGNALLWATRPSKSAALSHLTIEVQPVRHVLSAQDFRAFALKKSPGDVREIKWLDHNGIPLARYTTDNLMANMILDAKPTYRNIEAFLANDLLWVRIRFTAASLGVEEEKLFFSAIESAKFVDISHPSSSFDYYSLGRTFSAIKDYRRASANFASAVKLEQSHQQLNRRYFHDLIMKSVEAHVATSDLPAAAEVLEYGVTRDPANETFLMQLARTHAWMGDKAKTLAALKTTFQLMKKQKEIFEKTSFPGTTSHTMSLPDLNRDPAFKEMMKDKGFREAVKAMKK